MKRMKLFGLTLLAMFAVGAMASSEASAGNGPGWHILLTLCTLLAFGKFEDSASGLAECLGSSGPGHGSFEPGWEFLELRLYRLGASESLLVLSENVAGNVAEFAAGTEGRIVTIKCPAVLDHGYLYGGAPGLDLSTIIFHKCKVWGEKPLVEFPSCTVENENGGSAGLVELKALTELVYSTSKEEPPVYDLFTPDGGGTTFVKLVFNGTCPTSVPTSTAEAVTGNVAAELLPPAEGGVAERDTLMFPKTAIKTVFKWNPTTKAVETTSTKVGLTAFTASAVQSGEEEVWPEQPCTGSGVGKECQLIKYGVLAK